MPKYEPGITQPPLQQLGGVLAHQGHKENLVFII